MTASLACLQCRAMRMQLLFGVHRAIRVTQAPSMHTQPNTKLHNSNRQCGLLGSVLSPKHKHKKNGQNSCPSAAKRQHLEPRTVAIAPMQ